MAVTLMIGYPRGARFDVEYYLGTHLALAGDAWKRFGMGAWRVTTAGASTEGDGEEGEAASPFAALVEIDWPSREALRRARAETPPEHARRLADDIANYTDAAPVVWVMEQRAGGA
ncbi:hypothetical protein GGS23DRAFT_562979 [Durotheca rogersii]|uniref:uncharacterized protein n=1 Tax=Durotheca rogersii TaxID=419775 RepID=UPI0022201842|nr:uncharacterized protein GGS23DRAFT_562979 [Durotheca rogersii]KAI5864107.1 hypothetical protein GGS23DRAFT_562979 [Durotheca rogersii]